MGVELSNVALKVCSKCWVSSVRDKHDLFGAGAVIEDVAKANNPTTVENCISKSIWVDLDQGRK
jgi:hypothetical protein